MFIVCFEEDENRTYLQEEWIFRGAFFCPLCNTYFVQPKHNSSTSHVLLYSLLAENPLAYINLGYCVI